MLRVIIEVPLGGIKGQDYLTDEEREEARLLLRQMFVIPSNDVSFHQETQNLDDDLPLLKQQSCC